MNYKSSYNHKIVIIQNDEHAESPEIELIYLLSKHT